MSKNDSYSRSNLKFIFNIEHFGVFGSKSQFFRKFFSIEIEVHLSGETWKGCYWIWQWVSYSRISCSIIIIVSSSNALFTHKYTNTHIHVHDFMCNVNQMTNKMFILTKTYTYLTFTPPKKNYLKKKNCESIRRSTIKQKIYISIWQKKISTKHVFLICCIFPIQVRWLTLNCCRKERKHRKKQRKLIIRTCLLRAYILTMMMMMTTKPS